MQESIASFNKGFEFEGYSLNGCNVPAMMNLVDIAPAHCGTLMGVCNGFSSFAGFFVPLATTYFTEDDPSDPANWRNLFFLRYVCGQLIILVIGVT